MNSMINAMPALAVIASLLASTQATSQIAQPVRIQTSTVTVSLTPRTPDQVVSFYTARGFPDEMLNVIRQQCYIGVHISNNSRQTVWLDLSRWEFSAAGKPLKRQHRDYWKQRWQQMGIPLSKQSTFRWTLIPETLDYLPGEKEGGNILLPFTREPVTLTAHFATGNDKQGKTITISTDQLYCAEDAR